MPHIFEWEGMWPEQVAKIEHYVNQCDFNWTVLKPKLITEYGRDYLPVRYKAIPAAAWVYEAQMELSTEMRDAEDGGGRIVIGEGAHFVDAYWLTDEDRNFIRTLCNNGPWWGPSWPEHVGETWMSLFTVAFSPIPIDPSPFVYKPTDWIAAARAVRLHFGYNPDVPWLHREEPPVAPEPLPSEAYEEENDEIVNPDGTQRRKPEPRSRPRRKRRWWQRRRRRRRNR